MLCVQSQGLLDSQHRTALQFLQTQLAVALRYHLVTSYTHKLLPVVI